MGGLLSSERREGGREEEKERQRERDREKNLGERRNRWRLLRLEYLLVSSVTSRIIHGMMQCDVKETQEETRDRPRTFTPVEMARGRALDFSWGRRKLKIRQEYTGLIRSGSGWEKRKLKTEDTDRVEE